MDRLLAIKSSLDIEKSICIGLKFIDIIDQIVLHFQIQFLSLWNLVHLSMEFPDSTLLERIGSISIMVIFDQKNQLFRIDCEKSH